ncbi:hypothetical protein PV08_03516 [Exophiala spinifera]|uniref:Uncharacterized protein n=1 Tax=Exophiala spinifera TaxID=91928 RepID=A0A0D2A2P8_9EURO|nr:uncharacterized protein PV08_03516 [Exophiala spinifera]KIW19222.1 hypothetical protein PV08_03516 [Exophiala spinifera]
MIPPMQLHSWIHHDNQADTKARSSRKSQVFRHVAAHRKLERQQRTWKLRASALDLYQTLQTPQERHVKAVEKHFTAVLDPLDTLSLPATDEIQSLIHFDQEYIIPALSGCLVCRVFPSAYLQDDVARYGYLARIAAIKARCSDPGLYNQALSLKAEAMRRLRERLPQLEESNRLPRAVLSLMFAESSCLNFEAADIHVQLLSAVNESYGLDLDDLISVLHQDVQRAAMTLTRTRFSMHDRSWASLEGELFHSRAPRKSLDSYQESSLEWIMIELRGALTALDILQRAESPQSSREAATFKCLHVMASLIDHYHDTTDQVEKYTALAAVYRIRRAAGMERVIICESTVFDSGRVIIPQLRELLAATYGDLPALRLWALYIGAKAGDDWFDQELGNHSKQMGFYDPEMLQGFLTGFERSGLGRWNWETV